MVSRWRKARNDVGAFARYASLRLRASPPQGRPPPLRQGPLVVSGFLNETLGIGRAARLSIAALARAGFAPRPHDVRSLLNARGVRGAPKPDGPGGVWLLQCNPPETLAALAKADHAGWRSAYRIGYWAYELDQAPWLWRRTAALLHEIWTPSRFVAAALAGADAPVRLMPHPVTIEPAAPPRPPEYAPDARHVLAAADLRSSLTRKNMIGALAIWRRAIPVPRCDLRLVVKLVTRGEQSPPLHALRAAAADRPDISVVTRDMADAEAQGFLAHAALLLHPHRSEGFGLMLAEAALMGVPALATGWSGNVDFMADAPDLLIPARLARVEDRDHVYPRSARWAEPDLDAAADRLRRLLDDPARAADQAARVRARLDADHAAHWSREALTAAPFARWLA